MCRPSCPAGRTQLTEHRWRITLRMRWSRTSSSWTSPMTPPVTHHPSPSLAAGLGASNSHLQRGREGRGTPHIPHLARAHCWTHVQQAAHVRTHPTPHTRQLNPRTPPGGPSRCLLVMTISLVRGGGGGWVAPGFFLISLSLPARTRVRRTGVRCLQPRADTCSTYVCSLASASTRSQANEPCRGPAQTSAHKMGACCRPVSGAGQSQHHTRWARLADP